MTALAEATTQMKALANLAECHKRSEGGVSSTIDAALSFLLLNLPALDFERVRKGSRWFDLGRALGPCSWPGFGEGEDWRWVVVGAALFAIVTLALSSLAQVIAQQAP